MMNTRSMISSLSFAALALANPLSAAQPQEIFSQLVQPAPTVPQDPAARAKAVPALALLPAQTEAVAAVSEAGAEACVRMLPESLGMDRQALQSIGSAAVSVGPGMARTVHGLMLALMDGVEAVTGNEYAQAWVKSAKAAESAVIDSEVSEHQLQLRQTATEALQQLHVAPVYAVLTARAGHEQDFDRFCAAVEQGLRDRAGDAAQVSEWQGFTCIRVPQKRVFPNLIDLGESETLAQAFEQRALYLLIKKTGGTLLLAVAEDTADLAWPADEAESLLHAPALAEADAHASTLQAAFWVSPQLVQSMMEMNRSRVQQQALFISIFEKLKMRDAANAAAYAAAAQGATLLLERTVPIYPQTKAPLTLHVWMEGDDVHVGASCDSYDATYLPGELQHTAQAAAPDTLFYMETTAFTAPHVPSLQGTLQAVLAVAKGVAITLPEEDQDRLSPTLTMAEGLLPDVLGLGEALEHLTGGMSGPFSLTLTDAGTDSMPGIAFSAGVKNREALAEGWQKALLAAQGVAVKLGGSPEMMMMLPIVPQQLEGSAMRYTLVLPMLLPPEAQPQALVGDSRIVIGANPALNSRLFTAAEQALPFCGSVLALKPEALGKLWCAGANRKKAAANRRALERIEGIYGASIESGGVVKTHVLIKQAK